MAQLTQDPTVTLPPQLPTKWVVDCQYVGKGLPALKYLSKYLYRGVLPDKNIVSTTNDQVSFEYQNSQTKTTEIRTLPVTQFLRLVLQHLLPKGLRRVRDYGLLRGSAAKLRQRIRLMLAVAGPQFQVAESPIIPEVKRAVAIRACPCCQQPMKFMGVHVRLTSFLKQNPTEPNATV